MEKYKFQAKSEEGLLEKALEELNVKEDEILTKIYEEKVDIGKSIPYISELIGRLKEKGTPKTKSEGKEPSFNETFQKKLREIQKDRSNVLNDWKTKERDSNE